MNLRATLTGEWRFIDEPLVLYRVHEGNISHALEPDSFDTWSLRHRAKSCWQMREGEKAFVQMLSDLYSTGSAAGDPSTIRRARVNAARRLLDYQLRASYYTSEWDFSPREWLRFIGELLWLALKIGVKVVLPFIERRNDRWHYRWVLRTAGRSTDGVGESRD